MGQKVDFRAILVHWCRAAVERLQFRLYSLQHILPLARRVAAVTVNVTKGVQTPSEAPCHRVSFSARNMKWPDDDKAHKG